MSLEKPYKYLCRLPVIGSTSFFKVAFWSKRRFTCFLRNISSSSVFIFFIMIVLLSEEIQHQYKLYAVNTKVYFTVLRHTKLS